MASKIAQGGRRRRGRPALGTVIAAAVLAACSSGTPAPGPTGSPTSSPTGSSTMTATSSPTSSTSPGGTATPTDATGRAVPAYYAGVVSGVSPQRLALYREFATGTTADPVRAALVAMLGKPADPDYRTLWPAGTAVTSLERLSDGVARVGLSQKPLAPADLALQQVVWTVTAADEGVSRVLVTAGGTDLTPGGPVGRGPQVEVLAPVWLLFPTEGATVTSPLRLSGSASVFEAQLNYQVRTAEGDALVAQGSATATVGAPDRGMWSASVVLKPGRYVATAFDLSQETGRPLAVDSKTFTVQK